MRRLFIVFYEILIFAPLMGLLTIIVALSSIIGSLLGDRRFWGYIPPRYWSKAICRMALCRISVRKEAELNPNQSYIFVANHQGAFDIFLTYGYLEQKIKWVQKQSLRKIPFVGKACEIIGHVFVDNSSPAAVKRTIEKIEKELKEGVSMTIFPEGERTLTGKMGRFKKGAFRIAEDMDLPIVPITINGPFDVMKRHTYLINPGEMELIIHKPIEIKNLSGEEKAMLMDRTREIIHTDLWEKYK